MWEVLHGRFLLQLVALWLWLALHKAWRGSECFFVLFFHDDMLFSPCILSSSTRAGRTYTGLSAMPLVFVYPLSISLSVSKLLPTVCAVYQCQRMQKSDWRRFR